MTESFLSELGKRKGIADLVSPEMRIEGLEARVERLEYQIVGKCYKCRQIVKGWKAPLGSFAPEAWASLREKGIDPSTGHLVTCEIRNEK